MHAYTCINSHCPKYFDTQLRRHTIGQRVIDPIGNRPGIIEAVLCDTCEEELQYIGVEDESSAPLPRHD